MQAISRPLKIEDLWKTEVKCVFTGATGDSPQENHSVGIHWIFPPSLIHQARTAIVVSYGTENG